MAFGLDEIESSAKLFRYFWEIYRQYAYTGSGNLVLRKWKKISFNFSTTRNNQTTTHIATQKSETRHFISIPYCMYSCIVKQIALSRVNGINEASKPQRNLDIGPRNVKKPSRTTPLNISLCTYASNEHLRPLPKPPSIGFSGLAKVPIEKRRRGLSASRKRSGR